MRMFSSSANCVRMPPADLLVEPAASESRSTSTTLSTPSRRRWNAVGAPRAPPPMTTTSALLTDAVQELAGRLPVARGAAGPLDHDLLLDREVVVHLLRDLRLEDDPGVHERVLRGAQVVQRLHQAGPRRGLACVLQRVDERPADSHAVHDVRVDAVEARPQRRRVLVDDLARELHAGEALLRRRARDVARRDDAVDVRAVGRSREHEQTVRRDVADERVRGGPADLRGRHERRDRRRRRREDDECVGALALHRQDLLCEARRRRVVRLGVDDRFLLRAETDAETCVVVLAEGIVLVQDADARARQVRRDVLAVELALTRVVRLPAGRPRVFLVGEAPVRVAGREQHLRNLLGVRVAQGRESGRGAEAADDREDLVLLHELLRERDGLRRVVRVVEDLEIDLAAVDAAVVVDVVVVRLLRRRDRLVERRDAGDRKRATDVDAVGRDARICPDRPAGGRDGNSRNGGNPDECRQDSALHTHPTLLCMVEPGKPGAADYDAVGSDLIADLNRESSFHRSPAKPFGSASMIRITISPKTTSWPWPDPMRGTLVDTSGKRPMKSAPASAPQSEPSPATAAPISSWSESVTPNSFGCANPFVTRTKSDPATPAKAAETPKASVL